jgi:hypothetical protein
MNNISGLYTSLGATGMKPPAPGQAAKVKLRFGKWEAEGETKEIALNKIRQKSFEDVEAHEKAHLAAAQHLAVGGPEYTKNDDGITVAGKVNIRMGFDPNNLQQTMADAQLAKKAALAPAHIGDTPSAQDFKVAQQAEANYAKAMLLLQAKQRQS